MIAPKYSVIIYSFDLFPELLANIESWIRSGIKIYLFTSDDLERIENNPKWNALRENQFMQWFAVPYRNEDAGKTVYFEDGKITDPTLFQFLCNHAEENGFYSFNPEQYRAEHALEGRHLFVMAGAGTGKTTVMINRLLFLKHVNPLFRFDQVAMITFTNEAATVIKRRLHRRIKAYYELTLDHKYLDWLDEAKDLHVSTIHSFAKNLFEREGRELGFPPNIRIRKFLETRRSLIEQWIDRFAQAYPELYETFGRIRHYLLVQTVLSVVDKLENQSLHEWLYQKTDFGSDEKGFHKLLQFVIVNSMNELQKMKQEQANWEVNDLIRKLYELQHTDNVQLKKRFHTVMVDEFQDTDFMQVQFLLWLHKLMKCDLFVVGDVKQSIYRFRGADYTAFDQLRSGLDPAMVTEINLIRNYRTSSKLLKEMDGFFQIWGEKVRGFLYNSNDRLLAMINEAEEGIQFKALDLATVFKDQLFKLEGKETAILVRSNAEVQQIVEQCEEWGIFCEGQVQGQFYRSLPVRELYMLVRFLIMPQSASNCFSLNNSSYGENTISPKMIIKQFVPEKKNLWSIWKQQPDYAYWQNCLERSRKVPPIILLEQIIQERQPAQQYVKRLWERIQCDRPDAQPESLWEQCVRRMYQYQSRLEYLLYILKQHFSDRIATLYGIERFLRIHIQTDVEENDPPVPELENNSSQLIRCMTVHKAKGQEFDYVIMPRLDSPFLVYGRPHIFLKMNEERPQVAYQVKLEEMTIRNSFYTELKKKEQLELVAEETRLLYVAMTRAKKGLILGRPKSCTHDSPANWAELLGWGGTVFV